MPAVIHLANSWGSPAGPCIPVAVSDAAYGPTVADTAPAPKPSPEGMVWIPGGEYSMGSLDPRGSICVGDQSMSDARPIHRVYVDGT